jgi:hypothetical protein
VQLLAGIAQRLQVGARGGEVVQGFPGRGEPTLQVAADGAGGSTSTLAPAPEVVERCCEPSSMTVIIAGIAVRW